MDSPHSPAGPFHCLILGGIIVRTNVMGMRFPEVRNMGPYQYPWQLLIGAL